MEAFNIRTDLRGELRLDRDGRWWHDETCFTHQRLIELFHRSITWDKAKGDFILRVGQWECMFAHTGYVYFVSQIDDTKVPWLISLLNVTTESLKPETLKLIEGDRLICTLSIKHKAIFLKNAHQNMAEHMIDEDTLVYGKKKIRIPHE